MSEMTMAWHGIALVHKIIGLKMFKLISNSPKAEMDLPPLMSNG